MIFKENLMKAHGKQEIENLIAGELKLEPWLGWPLGTARKGTATSLGVGSISFMQINHKSHKFKNDFDKKRAASLSLNQS